MTAPRLSKSLPLGPLIGAVGVFAVFLVLLALKGEVGSFLGLGNLKVLLHEGTIPLMLALAMLLVVITGCIDLSVGALMALVTVVAMKVYILAVNAWGVGPEANAVAMLAGVLTGTLGGLMNGLLITLLKLPSFVVTLGTLSILRGSAIWLSDRSPIAFPLGTRPGWVDSFARSTLDNPGFWSAVGLAALVAVLLRRTVLGRHFYAIGSSEPTARLCGVAVGRTRVLAFTLAGTLTGWAGILLLAHGDSGNPSAGEGDELMAIAAVVIGGASLAGGRGTVLGAVLGVIVLRLLYNGVSLFNVPVEVRYILTGAIILANAALGRSRGR